MSKQPLQFRSENQTAVRQHCIMKRLYPQPVAHQPERLGGGIEKGEGEHAIEPVHALRSPLPPSMQDDFGRSEEHTSELQSLMRISYAVFCLKKKKKTSADTSNKTQKQAQRI